MLGENIVDSVEATACKFGNFLWRFAIVVPWDTGPVTHDGWINQNGTVWCIHWYQNRFLSDLSVTCKWYYFFNHARLHYFTFRTSFVTLKLGEENLRLKEDYTMLKYQLIYMLGSWILLGGPFFFSWPVADLPIQPLVRLWNCGQLAITALLVTIHQGQCFLTLPIFLLDIQQCCLRVHSIALLVSHIFFFVSFWWQ